MKQRLSQHTLLSECDSGPGTILLRIAYQRLFERQSVGERTEPDLNLPAALDSGFMSAAPRWVVLRAGALRLAAVEVALRWEAPGSAVLFRAAPCESDLSPEAVSRV